VPRDETDYCVADIKDAIITTYKRRFSCIDPDQLLLFRLAATAAASCFIPRARWPMQAFSRTTCSRWSS
jgi:hypothetical protein